MKKKDALFLTKKVSDFLKEFGFQDQGANDRSRYRWIGQFADTDLKVDIDFDFQLVAIFMMWGSPELVRSRRGDNVNKFTGKDNLHYKNEEVDEIFEVFKSAVLQGAGIQR